MKVGHLECILHQFALKHCSAPGVRYGESTEGGPCPQLEFSRCYGIGAAGEFKAEEAEATGGSWGLRALGVEETRQAGVSEWDAESSVVCTPMLGRGAFSNYDSYPITPFEPTNLSID